MEQEEVERVYVESRKNQLRENIDKRVGSIVEGICLYSFTQRGGWQKIRELAKELYPKNPKSTNLELAANEGYWPLDVAVTKPLEGNEIKPTLSVDLRNGAIVKGVHVYTTEVSREDYLQLATRLDKLDTTKIIDSLEMLLR
ncbi:hypothetical protein HY501_03215 [Candidatus Woesearchaeota archaeon]|nr:hypothetical protein [Candidatus Woesearchaeota archaeon]